MTIPTVFIPIAPGHKVPRVKGWSKATPEEAEAWWDEAEEDSNVALRLDNYVMVDADSMELADDFHNLVIEEGWPPPHVVKTPRGQHFYWRLPLDEEIRSFVLDSPHEGDLRVKSGPGQYALVPPSRTEHGEYQWVGNDRPGDAPFASVEVLHGLESNEATMTGASGNGAASGGLIQAGMRNTALTGFAGLMRRYGFDDDATMRVLNGLNHQLTESPLPDEEVAAIVNSSGRWEQSEFPEIRLVLEEEEGEEATCQGFYPKILEPLSEMELPPPAEWYWKPYLPAGRLVLLDGSEGIGKGMFSAYCATRMSGGDWGEPAKVLWMAAEDDPVEDIQKRMKAAGWKAVTHAEVYFFKEWPKFPGDIEVVARLVKESGSKLVVMDPGRSFIAREDGQAMSYNDEAAIRPALEKLNRMSRETGCTVLFVHHWNKDSQGSTRTRAGGTGAFAQVVRHRLSMASVGEDGTQEWAFEVQKSNIMNAGHLHSFKLVPHKDLDTAYLELGEPIEGKTLGSWAKERSQTLESNAPLWLDPADTLKYWLDRNGTPGSKLPSKAVLSGATGLSEAEITEGLRQLKEAGAIVYDGGRYFLPHPEPLQPPS